jgi:hypothetical protein
MNSSALVVGSLGAIAKRDGVSLAETFISVDAVILVDVSGSMQTEDSRGARSRYEVALEELAQLQASMPGKLGIIAFASLPEFTPGGQPRMIGGGTNLAAALKFAKIADVPGMRFIVISDGEPDSESQALDVARGFKGRIDTVYVGPEADNGARDFLRRLAAANGGQAVMAQQAQALAAHTERLLLA